jgi:hypothetical protein
LALTFVYHLLFLPGSAIGSRWDLVLLGEISVLLYAQLAPLYRISRSCS